MRTKSGYFKVKEMSEIYSVSEETIRRWARTKKISGKKIGKSWLFAKSITYEDKSENEAILLLGESAVRQKRGFPYDILFDGQKIDVKASKLGLRITKTTKKDHYYWRFNISAHSSNKYRSCIENDRETYCDYILFICYDDDWNNILRGYLVPSSTVFKKKGKSGSITLNATSKIFEKYRIFRAEKGNK